MITGYRSSGQLADMYGYSLNPFHYVKKAAVSTYGGLKRAPGAVYGTTSKVLGGAGSLAARAAIAPIQMQVDLSRKILSTAAGTAGKVLGTAAKTPFTVFSALGSGIKSGWSPSSGGTSASSADTQAAAAQVAAQQGIPPAAPSANQPSYPPAGAGYGGGGGGGGSMDSGVAPVRAALTDQDAAAATGQPQTLSEKFSALSTPMKVVVVAAIGGGGYFLYKKMRRGGRGSKS